MFTKDNTIRKRIMARIDARIDDAQRKFDEGAEKIHKDHDAKAAEIERKRQDAIDTHADAVVDEVLAK